MNTFECVASFPTSKKARMSLYAAGPWSRRDIEHVVTMLNLGLELGAYDEIEIEPTTETAPEESTDGR